MIKVSCAALVSAGKDQVCGGGNEDVMYTFHYVGHREMMKGY